MVAAELINYMIPPLKLSDDSLTALRWMEEFRVTQLPVADKKTFLGFITEEQIIDANNTANLISQYELKFTDINIPPNTHYLDLLKASDEYKVSLLPIIDEQNEYLGVVSVTDITLALAQVLNGYGPGGILVIRFKDIDYSMTEIARLVESNDVKILSSYVSNEPNSEYIHLTLKFNKANLSRVIATLERHGYRILSQYVESENKDDDKDRLDEFFKYLNI